MMLLFLKGFIVGLGKIIPGVSGAMLAINFGIYERLLDSLTNFFGNWKDNLKFLFIFGLGIIISIVLCSGLILYLITNYKNIIMMFFTGLILGGTYNFSKLIKYNYKNIILVILIIFLFILIDNINSNYVIKDNFIGNMMFFIGGYTDIFASIVPGISGTSLLIMMGLYNDILRMISMVYNYSYVTSHINIYLSYGIGMVISFIINTYLVNYLIKRYKNTCYVVILGLAIGSIIFLIKIILGLEFNILGIILLIFGIILGIILGK